MKNRLETANDKDKSTFTKFNLYLMKKSSNEVQDLIAKFKLDVSHKNEEGEFFGIVRTKNEAMGI